MHQLLLFISLIASISANAQFKVKQIRDTTSEGGNLSFPIIESAQRPEVARRINLYLQMNELNQLLSLPVAKNAFERFADVTEYSNEVVANTDRIVSFHFTSMSCLARCDQGETDYVFDAHTGDFVSLERLFTPEGLIATRHALLLDWQAKVAPLLKNENGGDDYKECVERINQLSQLPIERFSLSANEVSFWTEQCLSTAERAYDNTRGYFTKSFEELKPYLSAYGRSLFGEGSPTKNSQPLLHTVLRGTIDNRRQIMLILLPGHPTDAPDAVSGLMVFDASGKAIEVRGFVTDGKVTWHEATNKPNWKIDAAWDGATLKGTLKDLNTGHSVVFAATK